VAGLVVAGLWLALRSGGRRRIVPVFVGGSAGGGALGATSREDFSVTGEEMAGAMGAPGRNGAPGIDGSAGNHDAMEADSPRAEAIGDDAQADGLADRDDDGDEAVSGDSLSEPDIAWSDLAPAFTSAWTVPAGQWLLNGGDASSADDDEAIELDDEAHKREIAAVTEEADHAGD
jgi:hypothetical protein